MRRIDRSELPRFGILLGAMLLELALAPWLSPLPGASLIARAATALVLLAALGAIGLRTIGVVLFAAAIAGEALEVTAATRWALVVGALVRLVFLVFVFLRVLLHVLRKRHVTADTLAAAVCSYMLLGLVFADLYMLAVQAVPDAFVIPASFEPASRADLRGTLIYFSFSTLTTVGFGDVHAATPGVGGLAASEAVAGQVYLAVLIARLVGMHLAEGGSRSGGDAS